MRKPAMDKAQDMPISRYLRKEEKAAREGEKEPPEGRSPIGT